MSAASCEIWIWGPAARASIEGLEDVLQDRLNGSKEPSARDYQVMMDWLKGVQMQGQKMAESLRDGKPL